MACLSPPVSMRVLSTDLAIPADISIDRDLADNAAVSLPVPFLLPPCNCSPSTFLPSPLPSISSLCLSASDNVFILSSVNTLQIHLAIILPHPKNSSSSKPVRRRLNSDHSQLGVSSAWVSSMRTESDELSSRGVTCMQIRGELIRQRNKLICSINTATISKAGKRGAVVCCAS